MGGGAVFEVVFGGGLLAQEIGSIDLLNASVTTRARGARLVGFQEWVSGWVGLVCRQG